MKDMVNPIQRSEVNRLTPKATPQQAPPAVPGGQSFDEVLRQAQDVRFSNHAQKRLQRRNISLTEEGIHRLSAAVDKVEKRGGRDSLVLMDDLAFIVNVKDRLVVTALDANNRGEGVFTQIDSVVLADTPYDQDKT